jgi:hypothetical protein
VSSGDQVVHEFGNGRQSIRCSISTFRGRVYADIRQWWEPTPGEALKPTQKGVAILADHLDELEPAIAAFRAALGPGGRRPHDGKT